MYVTTERLCLRLLFLTFVWASSQLLAVDMFLESGDVRVRYVSKGTGEAVVLIHGFAEDLEKGWFDTEIFDRLVASGYQAIALDCRGHGKSSRLHRVDQYGRHVIQDLVDLLDQLNVEKTHVVGYSMGAAIANQFRHRYGDRLLSVTLSGFGKPPLPEKLTEALVQEIEGNLARMGLLAGNDPRSLACLCVGWRQWEVSDAALKGNSVRSLALIGADDFFLPDTKQLLAEMPMIKLEVVPGDHGTARSHPKYIEALLAFLQGS